MKKLICIACCSFFLFSGCGKTSYFQSTELVEVEDNISAKEQVVEDLLPETIFVQVAGAVVHPYRR